LKGIDNLLSLGQLVEAGVIIMQGQFKDGADAPLTRRRQIAAAVVDRVQASAVPPSWQLA
jgi:hypothetical protein